MLALDLSDKFTEEEITEQKIRDYANAYITRNHIEDVYQNIEISFVQLWQTEEYKNIAPLERVGLCDTVTVKYPALGVSVKAKVIKTIYDTIAEKYNKIELGKVKSQFGDTLIQGEKELKQSIIHNKSAMQKAIETATALITGQSGGYIIFRNFTDIFDSQGHKIETKTLPDGQPAEMLIMDKPDVAQATHVWRYNLSGWGYSSTGINGPYRLAATSNGAIVADFITTGTLNAGLIKAGIIEDENQKNYWNMYTGEFKFSDGFRDAMKYENGTMSINASIINTGSLNADRITTGALQDAQGTNYWNMSTGEFRLSANTKVGTSSSNQTLSNYVNSAASGSLTQQNVFNALTNNGALQGVYMSGGDLYINGSYIQAGTINANYIKAGTLSDTSGNLSLSLSNGYLTMNQSYGKSELTTMGLTFYSPGNEVLASMFNSAGGKGVVTANIGLYGTRNYEKIKLSIASNKGIVQCEQLAVTDHANDNSYYLESLNPIKTSWGYSLQINSAEKGSFFINSTDESVLETNHIILNNEEFIKTAITINGSTYYLLCSGGYV